MNDDLKRTFEMATLKREAAKMLNATEWKQYQVIQQRYAGLVQYEKRVHEQEYKTRVEIVRKRLINQAGAKRKDFKYPWSRRDGFDKDAINRQARRYVHNQHQQVLNHLEAQKIKEVTALIDRCEKRQELCEKPKRDFSKAVDRRYGERRISRSIKRDR